LFHRCVDGIRSLAAEYNIRSEGRAYIKASTAASYSAIESQVPSIKALCKKLLADLIVSGPDAPESLIPKGCAIFVISADVAVMLDVATGISDIDAEITKVHSKLQKSQGVIVKQKELLEREGFTENVSEVARSAEEKRLTDAEAAAENYRRTLEEFEKIKLGTD
jgi:valyl-tRNA synthetase